MDTACGTVSAKNQRSLYISSGTTKFAGEGQDPELDTILVNSFCK